MKQETFGILLLYKEDLHVAGVSLAMGGVSDLGSTEWY